MARQEKPFVMHWAAVIDFTIRKKKKLKLFHLDSTGFLNVNFKTPAIEKKKVIVLLKTDTASVSRFLLPPNSDHLMTGAHGGLLI